MLPNMQPQQPPSVTQQRRDLSAAWPWITIALTAIAAFVWGFTSQPAGLCDSLLGQAAQVFDQGAARQCQAATSTHTAGVALAILFVAGTAVLSWRRPWLNVADPAVRSLLAVGLAVVVAIGMTIAGSATASKLASDAAAAQARTAAAQEAHQQAVAQQQANAQASAQAAEQQTQQKQQDENQLATDVGTLNSDATAQQNDKTLANDIQQMQSDLATEQNDAATCNAANPDPGQVSADDSQVQSDDDQLQSDVQDLQQNTAPQIQQDVNAVQSDEISLQNDGANVDLSSAAAAIALGQKTLTDSTKAVTWANNQAAAILQQANQLSSSVSSNPNC
jgi:hypothetical protein